MELVEKFIAGDDDDATLDNVNVAAAGDNIFLIQDVQPHGRLGGDDNFNYNNTSTIMDSNADNTLNDTTTVNDDDGLDHSAVTGAAAQEDDNEEPGPRHSNGDDGRCRRGQKRNNTISTPRQCKGKKQARGDDACTTNDATASNGNEARTNNNDAAPNTRSNQAH